MASPPWVIISSGFNFTAGQGKAVASLADFLARSQTPVHLVGHSFDARLTSLPGVTAHWVPTVPGVNVAGNGILAVAGRAIARRVVRQWPDARVVVNGGNCMWGDINWVHFLHHAWAPNLAMAPRWFRVKERVVSNWDRRRERRALQSARVVLTNSRRTTADVVQLIGVPADRVRTVYYGADPSWMPPTEQERLQGRQLFNLSATRPVVVFVGGFGYDQRKGFDTLLAAWGKVCQSADWDAELVMAGGGKASGTLASQLAREGISKRVRMVGFTERVFDLLAAADLLVSPVRYEPYGLNVQEAICRGIPAMVSATAGVAEEYPAQLEEMLIPDPEDADDLAARLRRWRADMAGWRCRFQSLSDRIRSRTWDRMAQEIVEATTVKQIASM